MEREFAPELMLYFLFNLYLTRQVIKNKFLFTMAARQTGTLLEGRS